MERKIEGILKEIYRIDSGLKEREKEIVPIIESTLEAEAEFDPDEEFVFELRKELSEKTGVAQNDSAKGRVFKKTGLDARVVAVIFLVFAALFAANSLHRGEVDFKRATGISSKVLIDATGENAFGALSDLSVQQNSANSSYAQNISSRSGSGQESAAVDSVATLGTAGTASAIAPAGMGDGVSSDAKVMPPYQTVYYSYVYKGAEFSQDQEKMNVLRRVVENGTPVGDIAKQVGSGLFDFGKFDNSKVALVSFYEDKDYGYRADADLTQGYVSIYKNWLKWPNIYADCKDENCYKSRQIKAGDVPSDSETISGCKSFLDNYGVDLSAYGEPKIDKRYVNYYAKADISYPEEMPVIYPLIIDGKGVYENGGEFFGLNLSFDVRNRKVSSVNNLRTNNYQSSAYDAETDVQKILAKAQNIDGTMPLPDDKSNDIKKVELELDTPVLGYEHLWRYENGQSSEFMVPCLVFLVKENADIQNYWRKQVVVPVIKDFLNRGDDQIVVPMAAGKAAESTAK